MDLIYAQASVTGPVRDHNEDSIGFLQPSKPELIRTIGILAVLADGVGGSGRGELASQTAVQSALKVFSQIQNEIEPADLLRKIFQDANKSVYDAALQETGEGRMATTLTASIFRHDEIAIGHVGDCRVYLLRKGTLRRLTSDHSYVALQVKLGLIKEHEAMASPMRSIITRSLGQDLTCAYDTFKHTLAKDDVVVQCSDGLYATVLEDELRDLATRHAPEPACAALVDLALKRGAPDNISVQVIKIREIEQRHFYRGAAYYVKPAAAATGNEIQAGQLLDDRFEIVELINRSGMASIFKALDRTTGVTVAVKVPLMQFESEPAFFARFQREEQIGQTLQHPGILKISAVEGKSRPYIVMEYLQGQTLGALLREIHPLPERDAARIASLIAQALAHMHQHKIIHRDLKPQNIMICDDGSIRIMDFGIAKSLKLRRLTFVGFSPSMGTPDYMAPEQVKGRRGDERTDIYALGAILYEMCTGTTPFEGESPYTVMNARLTGDPVAPRKLNPHLTPAMEEIILHAMERIPALRFTSIEKMQAELDDYEKVELVERFRRLQEPRLWKSRFRLVPLILFVLLTWVAGFLLIFWYLQKHAKK